MIEIEGIINCSLSELRIVSVSENTLKIKWSRWFGERCDEMVYEVTLHIEIRSPITLRGHRVNVSMSLLHLLPSFSPSCPPSFPFCPYYLGDRIPPSLDKANQEKCLHYGSCTEAKLVRHLSLVCDWEWESTWMVIDWHRDPPGVPLGSRAFAPGLCAHSACDLHPGRARPSVVREDPPLGGLSELLPTEPNSNNPQWFLLFW